MRIFVSSTYLDLEQHRAAAIGVLRQLGHEVLAMEDMVAGAAPPLAKVIDMVDRADAYVGVFAWRYGAISPVPSPVAVEGVVPGQTSITHCEYLRAKEREIPTLAFLLEEREPWSPALIDGLDGFTPVDGPWNIRALRSELLQEKVVAFFTTPASLAARVAPAVTMLGLSRQIDIRPAAHVAMGGSGPIGDSGGSMIGEAVARVKVNQQVLRIDLADTWWHTRLYLLAALAERISHVRRILVVNGSVARQRTTPQETDRCAFVGLLSTSSVLNVLGPMLPAFARFEALAASKAWTAPDPGVAARALMRECWEAAFVSPKARTTESEESVAVGLTPDLLRRWFGEMMVASAVEITDPGRVSTVDLLRLVNYPGPFVPILGGRDRDDAAGVGVVEVVDKAALNARLAHSYLTELRERDRIV